MSCMIEMSRTNNQPNKRVVAQSCPTLCDPMDCSLRGSFIHGIFQAGVLEWVAIAFSMKESQKEPNLSLTSKPYIPG